MEQKFQKEIALGYERITATSAAIGLTVPKGTVLAIITPDDQAVRWRDDGTDPTATIGYPLAAGAELRYTANALGKLRFIAQTAGAILHVTYYG